MKTLQKLQDLSGRTALITGGAGHIGSAAAEALIEAGARVALLDLEASDCERTAKRLASERRGAALSVSADLSDETSTRGAVRETLRKFKRLDILIHCAGYTGDTRVPGWAVPFEKQTLSAFERAMRVNLSSVFALVHEARAALAASGKGSVILFSSIYGVAGPDPSLYAGTPLANPMGYGASKGGLLQLTRHLATTLAPRVRVNAISPGGVLRKQPSAFVKRYAARTPLKRMATEEDMKGAVAYLASDLSAYVTGQNLVVDGGWTAW